MMGIEKVSRLKFGTEERKRFQKIQPKPLIDSEITALLPQLARNFTYMERRDVAHSDAVIANTHRNGGIANYWYLKLMDLSDKLYFEDLYEP